MSPVLTQPLLRPGPSTPPALAVRALPEARPRYEAAEPEPINPMRLTAWDNSHAASPVSADEYLNVSNEKSRRQREADDADDPSRKKGRCVPVIDVATGKQFAKSVADAAAKLGLDQWKLRARFYNTPVIVQRGHSLRLDRSAAPAESTVSPEPEDADE